MDRATLDEILHSTNPFSRYDWHGRLTSEDGTDVGDFTADDVAEVVAAGDTGEHWDGEVAAILLLNDGRYVSYETFYGPTGDGFYEDAYGGDADLVFSSSLENALRYGLTKNGRKLVGMPLPHEAAPPVGSNRPGLSPPGLAG